MRLFNQHPTNKYDVKVASIKNNGRIFIAVICFLSFCLDSCNGNQHKVPGVDFLQYLLIYGENQQSGFKNPEGSAIDIMERHFINDSIRSP